MITHIEIDGFKSFQNFEMDFTPLTIIAGTNASGKSNLFDALQLLSDLAEADLKTAFGKQRGNASELFTQYSEEHYATEMKFVVEMLVNRTIKDNWGAEAILKYTRLRYELKIIRKVNDRNFEELLVVEEQLTNLKHNDDTWVKKYINKEQLDFWRPEVKVGKRKEPYIETKDSTFYIRQDGVQGKKRAIPTLGATQTVLSSFNSVDFPHILAAKEEMRSWKFLQLNPEQLREPTNYQLNASDKITSSGKNLAAALFRIQQDDEYSLVQISRKINRFLPEFTEVRVRDDKANRQFIISLIGLDGREFSSRVLSEGTLRILALCIFLFDNEHKSLLCFEEPENGIHPFRIQTIAQLIKDLSTDFDVDSPLRQIIVNTHSPVLLAASPNWVDNKYISVWFSQLVSLMTQKDGKRINMKISEIERVSNDLGLESLSVSKVKRYLESAFEMPESIKNQK